MSRLAVDLRASILVYCAALSGGAPETWNGTFVQDNACPTSVQRVEISFDYGLQTVLLVSAGRRQMVFNLDLPRSDINKSDSAAVFCRYSGDEPPKDKDALYFKLRVPDPPFDAQPALLRVKRAGSAHRLYLEPLPEG
jgi:hypothetical protein